MVLRSWYHLSRFECDAENKLVHNQINETFLSSWRNQSGADSIKLLQINHFGQIICDLYFFLEPIPS